MKSSQLGPPQPPPPPVSEAPSTRVLGGATFTVGGRVDGPNRAYTDDWRDTLVLYIVIPLRLYVYKVSQAYNSLVFTSSRVVK